MIVRAAVAADIAAAAGVAARSYRGAFAGILADAALDLRTPEFFAARFRESLDLVMVAESNGAVIGFSVMTHRHIDMLFVDPGRQGAGVGHALLEDAEHRGANSLECFRANFAARRFYERAGWRLAHAYARPFANAEHEFVRYEKR